MDIFSLKLKTAIEQSGLSLRELEERSGVPRSAIHRYIKGVSKIPLSRVIKLAKALGIDAADLVGWTDDKSPVSDSADERAREFINLFSALSDADQDAIMSLLRTLAKKG